MPAVVAQIARHARRDVAAEREFVERASQILGVEHVVASPEELERRSRDPVPGADQPIAFVYPGSVGDVQQIMRLADRLGIAVWPHSTGRNWGWSNAPLGKGAVMMILERMNRILRVDPDLAYAVVEPGVSYEDLNNHLKARGIKLWTDCTGGPPKGSVLGNALDRGVGVTTHGEHFASLCGLEVVLPSGEVLRTGGYPEGKEGTRYTYKWGVGPYLEGLFSQGNLGVVVSGGIWLMPEPEAHFMFGFQIHDEGRLAPLLNVLRRLALDGVIPDKIRVTNDYAVLTLLTQWLNERIDGAHITPEEMRRLNEKYRFGAWSFCSSVYGRREQVEAARAIIVRELSAFGRVLFFDDPKVALVERLVPALVKRHQNGKGLVDKLASLLLKLSIPMIQTLPPLYGVYKGIPTEKIVRRAYFRSDVPRPDKDVHVARDRVGLMWFGPLVPLEGGVVFELMDHYRRKFHAAEFDCYITILMLNARTVVPLLGIMYRTDDREECARAVALYDDLYNDALDRGYQQFRCGRLGWRSIYRDNPRLLAVNTKIKEAFDPNHIVAPGKYGIE